MASEVTRQEFAELQQEFEGEKLVTRHILEQSRRNADDLAAIKSRLDRVERRLDGVGGNVGGLAQKVDALTHNLPKIVGEVMREVLDERDRKR